MTLDKVLRGLSAPNATLPAQRPQARLSSMRGLEEETSRHRQPVLRISHIFAHGPSRLCY